MAGSDDFPHLPLIFSGEHRARLSGGGETDPRVLRHKTHRQAHALSLQKQLETLRKRWPTRNVSVTGPHSASADAPVPLALLMPAGQFDLGHVEKQFGLELVAEDESGVLLTGAESLEFSQLEEAIRLFAANAKIGGANVAGVLEIYGPDDSARLDVILDERIRGQWPFESAPEMTLDIWMEVPHHPGYLKRPIVRRKKNESEEAANARRADLRNEAVIKAATIWDQKKEQRLEKLVEFVAQNSGEILDQIEDLPIEERGVVYFPDSILIRVTMSGQGFRDLVLNFPWLVALEVPADIEFPQLQKSADEEVPRLAMIAPPIDAPKVCIIDSGIQEGHLYLEMAINPAESRCFLPTRENNQTQDEVKPSGHGTKVAGAVLFPEGPPASGTIQIHAWLQNARVLNELGEFDPSQNHLRSFQRVIEHFTQGTPATRIFVHCINDRQPCRKSRMTAWPALLDSLSHHYDVLIVQSSGNLLLNSHHPARFGVKQHLAAGRKYPDYLLEPSARLASPAQSLHALSVGSVASEVWQEGYWTSMARNPHGISPFSRAGWGLWTSVKPDVVEFGGDFQVSDTGDVRPCQSTAPILVQSTLHGSGAIGRDVGTSFAAPKVAHIAAHLQAEFPDASTLLYRALIVNSARWPDWAEQISDVQERQTVLRTLGYGVPDLARATTNRDTRVTLVTRQPQFIRNQQALVFQVPIPVALRDVATPCNVRIDVTLCYSAEPRPTRASRHGYLETWLGWIASHLEEPMDSFLRRATKTDDGPGRYRGLPWMLHNQSQHGGIEGAFRQAGTAQKDWAIIRNTQLPDQFGIAVQAHKGWNRGDGEGGARFALVVSIEALGVELPVYSVIRNEVQVLVEQEISH